MTRACRPTRTTTGLRPCRPPRARHGPATLAGPEEGLLTTTDDRALERSAPSPTGPGLLLGVGLGGFVDGIVLHQILQWHQMLSAEYPPTNLDNVQRNVTADGFFHTFTWIAVVVGLALLWRAVRAGHPWTWRMLVGWMLAGWGLFNLLEGIVDHHLLQVHRVNPEAANPLLWDLGFLALGLVLLAGGVALARSGRNRSRAG